VVFRNTASLVTCHDPKAMIAIQEAVFSAMQNFTDLGYFGSSMGFVHEFSARIEDEGLYVADLIEFSSDGKITNFRVMTRPAHVVSTLSAAVARQVTFPFHTCPEALSNNTFLHIPEPE